MYITFGDHKGKPISDVPSSYLKWIAENFDEDKPWKKRLVEAADKEWQWRE